MKNRHVFIGAALWIALVAASATWNISQFETAQQQVNLEVARSFFRLMVNVREWNAAIGGVYAPVSATIIPNPYLKDPDRDIALANGVVLTKLNPAYMTRLIAGLAQANDQVYFHITSLKPINPDNRADPWEITALTSFERDARPEYYAWDARAQTFRYMAPLITTTSCLKCHKHQGYKVGDIRGGISLAFSARPVNPWPLILSHTAIALVGLAAIRGFSKRLASAFARLERQSQIDALTLLHNRRYFDTYLQREILRARRQQSPLSIILCDVDYFKSYNDIYGHQAGDRCLREIAAMLSTTIKRPGDLVARYGGEEFVMILPDTPAAGALLIADLVRTNIEALAISHSGSQVSAYVTISLGVATSSESAIEASLLERADKALYQAKQSGRNVVVSAAGALATRP